MISAVSPAVITTLRNAYRQKSRVHRRGHHSAQYLPAMPDHHRHQVALPPHTWHTRDIRAPRLIGSVDLQIPQQVLIHLVPHGGHARARVRPIGGELYQPHQALEPFAVDQKPVLQIERPLKSPRSIGRFPHVQLTQDSHCLQIFCGSLHCRRLHPIAFDAQRSALSPDEQ